MGLQLGSEEAVKICHACLPRHVRGTWSPSVRGSRRASRIERGRYLAGLPPTTSMASRKRAFRISIALARACGLSGYGAVVRQLHWTPGGMRHPGNVTPCPQTRPQQTCLPVQLISRAGGSGPRARLPGTASLSVPGRWYVAPSVSLATMRPVSTQLSQPLHQIGRSHPRACSCPAGRSRAPFSPSSSRRYNCLQYSLVASIIPSVTSARITCSRRAGTS